MFKSYEKIDECRFCSNKAEIIYLKSGFFGLIVRLLCKKCARQHQNMTGSR